MRLGVKNGQAQTKLSMFFITFFVLFFNLSCFILLCCRYVVIQKETNENAKALVLCEVLVTQRV